MCHVRILSKLQQGWGQLHQQVNKKRYFNYNCSRLYTYSKFYVKYVKEHKMLCILTPDSQNYLINSIQKLAVIGWRFMVVVDMLKWWRTPNYDYIINSTCLTQHTILKCNFPTHLGLKYRGGLLHIMPGILSKYGPKVERNLPPIDRLFELRTLSDLKQKCYRQSI